MRVACLLQDECGNRVEAQQSHLDCLGLGVAASIKEDGEASQMDELQASLQACLLSALPRHACCNEDGTRVMLYQLNASLLTYIVHIACHYNVML